MHSQLEPYKHNSKIISKKNLHLPRRMYVTVLSFLYILCIGGLSYALFISLLISKLFCTKGCMGGWWGGTGHIVNSIRPVGGGEGWWGDKVNSLSPVPPSPYPSEHPSQLQQNSVHVLYTGGRGRGAHPPPPPPYQYNTCCSKTHVLKTHSIQYRIQNKENHVHKITM